MPILGLFPDNITMTEQAMARLTALNEHTELGSGMRVAMRDLEIRGAGSLLGAEQSGNMSAVGFDLFAQMLATAVNMTREGNTSSNDYLPPALSDIVVNVPDHTYFPEEYCLMQMSAFCIIEKLQAPILLMRLKIFIKN